MPESGTVGEGEPRATLEVELAVLALGSVWQGRGEEGAI